MHCVAGASGFAVFGDYPSDNDACKNEEPEGHDDCDRN
jgi:hypothetical protein